MKIFICTSKNSSKIDILINRTREELEDLKDKVNKVTKKLVFFINKKKVEENKESKTVINERQKLISVLNTTPHVKILKHTHVISKNNEFQEYFSYNNVKYSIKKLIDRDMFRICKIVGSREVNIHGKMYIKNNSLAIRQAIVGLKEINEEKPKPKRIKVDDEDVEFFDSDALADLFN